jgi:hypothetical protein
LAARRLLLLLILIAGHLAVHGVEITWRPLYPWDAWATWAQKTRVWFELRQLVAFVPPEQWLDSHDISVFTTRASLYPPTIPLIQLWTLMGLDQWNDALMNLPWLLCASGLGFALYAQARLWGVGPLPALVAVYLLLSLPLLSAHIGLAGYADLWLAAIYGLAVMALLHWGRNGDKRQGLLALLAVVAVTQIKDEGGVWALTLLLPALIVWLPRYWLYGLLVLVLTAGTAVLLTGGIHTEIPGVGHLTITAERVVIPHLKEFKLGFHPGVGEIFVQNMYVWGNWHMLWWLAPAVLLLALPHLRTDRVLIAAYALLAAAAGFVVFMFFFTELYQWAKDATSLNRIMLHLVPAMLFILVIVYHAVRRLAAPLHHRPALPASPPAE